MLCAALAEALVLDEVHKQSSQNCIFHFTFEVLIVMCVAYICRMDVMFRVLLMCQSVRAKIIYVQNWRDLFLLILSLSFWTMTSYRDWAAVWCDDDVTLREVWKSTKTLCDWHSNCIQVEMVIYHVGHPESDTVQARPRVTPYSSQASRPAMRRIYWSVMHHASGTIYTFHSYLIFDEPKLCCVFFPLSPNGSGVSPVTSSPKQKLYNEAKKSPSKPSFPILIFIIDRI